MLTTHVAFSHNTASMTCACELDRDEYCETCCLYYYDCVVVNKCCVCTECRWLMCMVVLGIPIPLCFVPPIQSVCVCECCDVCDNSTKGEHQPLEHEEPTKPVMI